ncbi:MAG: dipicolinate synthase subunit B [Clostridia bacterium]|nr:dipicolinate synthase subunit B [Clostridia bacterium]
MIGYAFCGSFCTLSHSLKVLKDLTEEGWELLPIMSDAVYRTDTRFWEAEKFRDAVSALCPGKEIIHTVVDAEPLGPQKPLDALIIAPCTGNTLAKMANGITDTPVTMAAKAHLRADRPLLIALASNDSMSANLSNVSKLLLRKQVYFVPMRQDDPGKKPYSLVADFSLISDCLSAALTGKQRRPLFL